MAVVPVAVTLLYVWMATDMRIAFITIAVLFALTGKAQELKGSIIDDATEETIPGASVVALTPNDSIFLSYGITNNEGLFVLKKVPKGEIILQVSFLGYNTYYRNFTIENAETDAGIIRLTEKAEELEEVTVQGERIPIVIKGDTIQYDADAFKTNQGDRVEDLLKMLPGIEVESDGTIKAQGEEVQRVYVDGKEFFGNDPKIATRNLPADAIKKVDLYDRRSEIAEFTGIDDGEREKSINLQLREDKKKGYFGDASAGYGTQDRFNTRLSVNRFNSTSQLSFIGGANNVNAQSFTLNDYLTLGGGFGRGGAASLLGFSNPRGITNLYSGGLNLNHEFSKKTEVQSSYFLNNQRLVTDTESERVTFLESGDFRTDESQEGDNSSTGHRFSGRLEHEFSKTSDLRFTLNGNYNDNTSVSTNEKQSFGSDGELINESLTSSVADGNSYNVQSSLLFRKKLNEDGRTVTFSMNGRLNENDRNNFFNADNVIVDSLIRRESQMRQLQENISSRQNVSADVRFIEPINAFNSIQASYSYDLDNNGIINDFYNIINERNIKDDTLSRSVDSRFGFHNTGLTWRYNRQYFNISAGAEVQLATLGVDYITAGRELIRNYNTVLPNAAFEWKRSSQYVRLNYRTQQQAPSTTQLQPVVDNSDPFNIYVGNPDLEPSYIHNLNLSYFLFDQFTNTNVFASFTTRYVLNNIVNQVSVDRFLQQQTTPVNTDFGLYNNLNFNFGTTISKLGIKVNLGVNAGQSRYITFVNGVENIVLNNSLSPRFTVENRNKEKFDLRVGTRWSGNLSRFSENSANDQTFQSLAYFYDASWNIGWGIRLQSELTFNQYFGQAFSEETIFPLLNASIEKSFTTSKKWRFRVEGFDILNTNQGITRTSNVNYVFEERQVILNRYIMGTLSYDIGMGSGNTGKVRINK